MKLGKIAVVATVVAAGLIAPAPARAAEPPKIPTAIGYGGAVSTVDPTATAVGVEVLRRGGNAVDAAVAAAATLGVTEPFSAGIGGGGFFVYYDARTKRVHTIDGRESAPAVDARGRVRQPGRPGGRTRSRRRGSAASRSACPARWRPGSRRCASGAPARWAQSLAPGGVRSPSAASRSTRRSASRSPTTRPRSRQFDATSDALPARRRAAGGRQRRCATPTSPTPTGEIARRGTDAVLRGRDRPRHRRHRAAPAGRREPDAAVDVPDPPRHA